MFFFKGLLLFWTRLFDKSCKYLEFLAWCSRYGCNYQLEYISCLIALQDIRSQFLIDKQLESLNHINEEKWNEAHCGFLMFLLCRRSYCLIELKQYEQAEKTLKHILQNEPENEFAR